MHETLKVKSYKDLSVWQKSSDLAVLVHTTTKKYPSSELYGLVNQMRRAVISISSNLAEGFKRFHGREKIQFYRVAYGSAAELESQIEISLKLEFLSRSDYEKLTGLAQEISKMIEGLIKSLNSKFYSLNSSPRSGFTLVELVVAIGLFSLLISIALGGFIQALRSERQTVALLAANSNVSLVLEQMAREVRTGKNFSVSSGGLHFTNAAGSSVSYCLNPGIGAIERGTDASCGGGLALTSGNVLVRSLNFVASGVNAGDLYPPRIMVAVSLSARGEPGVQNSIINLQTTVSARNL